jgi:hypothetical protein
VEWVREVARALIDLLEGDLPAAAGRWFVDGEGRHLLPRRDTHPRRPYSPPAMGLWGLSAKAPMT